MAGAGVVAVGMALIAIHLLVRMSQFKGRELMLGEIKAMRFEAIVGMA